MKKKKIIRYDRIFIVLAILASIAFIIYFAVKGAVALYSMAFPKERTEHADIRILEDYDALLPPIQVDAEPEEEEDVYIPSELIYNDDTEYPGGALTSSYGILYCVDTRRVLASKASKERMYPASMTKIMTLIVAVESIDDLDDTFEMTYEITDPLYAQGATVTGLLSGETVPLIDLLYGIILPSGADATIAIAQYVSGSEEAFVELMNEKCEELGLEDTHFMNTSGLHHTNHYTTAYDMAIILDYAIHNDICKQILSTYKYTTTSTPQHPEGITMLSTMFKKVSSDSIEGMEICGGKTGFTSESQHCLASFAKKNGRTYIAVTAYGSGSNTIPVDDLKILYGNYIG